MLMITQRKGHITRPVTPVAVMEELTVDGAVDLERLPVMYARGMETLSVHSVMELRE